MMKKAELIFSTYIEDKVMFNMNANDPDETLEEITVEEIVNELTEAELRQLIVEGTKHFMIHEYTLRGIVKRAIDNFDPYCIGPNTDGPYDEYDPEVDAIVERLTYGMSEEDIRRIIEAIFIYYFDATFPSEYYERPAREIYRLLDDILLATAEANMQDDE